MNHSDSSATLEKIIRAKINCKGPGRKIPKIFLSRVFRAENSCFPGKLNGSECRIQLVSIDLYALTKPRVAFMRAFFRHFLTAPTPPMVAATAASAIVDGSGTPITPTAALGVLPIR